MKRGLRVVGVRVVVGLMVVIVGAVGAIIFFLSIPLPWTQPIVYGVTFSAPHATGLGLDWQAVYDAILNDLGVKKLRLAAYWNQIEPALDRFDWSTLDYQMDQAALHQASVILAVGRKLPRWPECHQPEWAHGLSASQQQERVLKMLEVVVERYRDHPALAMWQLENEPLFDFGECPSSDSEFLTQEEALVRSLDTHPILITDSGELNWWLGAARYGDVLGTTMYRTVFSGRTHQQFHYDYLFPAWLYRFKARLVKIVRGHDVIISELQGEPWGRASYTSLSTAEREQSFNPRRFRELDRFAQRTQLPEAYWWGVEYWYWEKVKNSNPVYWDQARAILNP